MLKMMSTMCLSSRSWLDHTPLRGGVKLPAARGFGKELAGVFEVFRRRARDRLDSAQHLIAVDRAHVESQAGRILPILRIAVDGEERSRQRLRALDRQARGRGDRS